MLERLSSIPWSSTSNILTRLAECGMFTGLVLLNTYIHVVDPLLRTLPLSSVTLHMCLLRDSVYTVSIIFLVTQLVCIYSVYFFCALPILHQLHNKIPLSFSVHSHISWLEYPCPDDTS
ncbi:MAG: hypothetical protein NXY57DRAFT_1025950 [Lentinula lateritia]|nr:MAG: hypothetical protein NXY57DRAFT_1025950 [Lentinula lateritia]